MNNLRLVAADEEPRRWSFWVSGPLPGMNEIIAAAKGFKGRGFGYAKMKREWTDAVQMLATVARLPAVKRARFTFRWVEKDRRRNPDNVASAKKLILDGLVKARVLANDGWSEVAGWTDTFEVGAKPGVEVTLIEARVD